MFYNVMGVFCGYEPKSEVDFLDKRKGGDINNDINMNGNDLYRISHTPRRDDSSVNKNYVIDSILGINDFQKQLSETLFEEYRAGNIHTVYSFEKGSNDEIVYNTTTTRVSRLIDQGLNKYNAHQANTNAQPKLCTRAETVNSRYYLKFDGACSITSEISLKVLSQDKDIVNVFIVYRQKTRGEVKGLK